MRKQDQLEQSSSVDGQYAGTLDMRRCKDVKHLL